MKIINARLIDGTGKPPAENATLVFGERITRLDDDPGQHEIIDAGGRTVIPGLVNAHIHLCIDANAPDSFRAVASESLAMTTLRAAGRARRMLQAGITTARDLGGREYVELAVRDLIRAGELKGPHLLCAGKLITMTGGHGYPLGRESDGVDDVRRAVREQLKAGADVIKIMATGGVLTPGVEPGAAQLEEEEIRAGVVEAHKASRMTATHAQGTAGVKAALRAGIDTVEHGIFLDDECIELMKARDVVFVPTLAAPYRINQAGLARGIPKYVLDKSERVYEAHQKSFQMALRAGVLIAGGNDGGTPFNPQEDLVTELSLMVGLGMSPLDAIRAGTWGSARALKLDQAIGTVEIGKDADLVILDGDPLQDMSALGKVWRVIQHGKVVHG